MVKTKTRFGIVGFELTRKGLVRVDLPPAKAGLRAPASAGERRVAVMLAGYFSGKIRRFNLPLDLSKATQFSARVLRACAAIPYGQVVSYGELARRAGKPGAARAAGSVMARNPIPIVIPCHRVVGRDMSLHGFGGGLGMKKALLELEGVKVRGSGPRARVQLRASHGK